MQTGSETHKQKKDETAALGSNWNA